MVCIITHLDCDTISKVMPVNQSKDIITLSLPIEGADVFTSLYIDSAFNLNGDFIENFALGNSISFTEDLMDWLNSPLERINF